MQLRDLQKEFKTELLRGQTTGVQPLIEARNFHATQRLNVYRNNIETTLIETLASIYPVSCLMVGEAFFNHMALAYVRSQYSDSGDLRHYGAELPTFMQSMSELRDLGYLPDIAKIDWACHSSFHAASIPAVEIDRLGEYSEQEYENLQFTLHPAVSAIQSDYPIFDIWDFATAPTPNESVPAIHSDGQQVLVYRVENTVKVAQIGQAFYRLFDLIAQQLTLGTVFPSLLATIPEYNLEKELNRLFSFGAVSLITIKHR